MEDPRRDGLKRCGAKDLDCTEVSKKTKGSAWKFIIVGTTSNARRRWIARRPPRCVSRCRCSTESSEGARGSADSCLPHWATSIPGTFSGREVIRGVVLRLSPAFALVDLRLVCALGLLRVLGSCASSGFFVSSSSVRSSHGWRKASLRAHEASSSRAAMCTSKWKGLVSPRHGAT
jgi:hypothetical protein